MMRHVERFGADIRYAWRTLARTPGVLAVLVLCLGLGVNTTLFTLFNVTVLQGPTARDASRLVQIEPGNGDQISYPRGGRDRRLSTLFLRYLRASLVRFLRVLR